MIKVYGRTPQRRLVAALAVLSVLTLGIPEATAERNWHDRHSIDRDRDSYRSLDGNATNRDHPSWGAAGTQYSRVTRAAYADDQGTPTAGPNARFVSNRIFNDLGVNLFSENNSSQWVWAWGQFVDHDLGLRDETPAEDMSIEFDSNDPLEQFTNDFGVIQMNRTPAAQNARANTRQQTNTITSFIDGSQIYGSDANRDAWLRDGAKLLLPNNYLPKATARGDVASAPAMDLMGRLTGNPSGAIVAGDVRANENVALTAIQTLFAPEHNRIVDLLPRSMNDEQKFQTARRVVGAEIQRITYTEFLPAVGVKLSNYREYDSSVNPSLGNEFATTGFRAHSMVHGEFEVDSAPGQYTPSQLSAFTKQGIAVEDTTLVIPLTVAFGNPDLLQSVGLAGVLSSLSGERQYRNDEQIDNSMRSVLFDVLMTGDPVVCQTPIVDPSCFRGVVDLGALDLERAHDHGIPNYNQLRQAYGLEPKRSFTEITGENTDRLPRDMTIDDPRIMAFTELRDAEGNLLDPADPETIDAAVTGKRASTLASRLKAVYKDVDDVDAFTGMLSEPHIAGTELGELQTAIWKKQFEATRDGDRNFYLNDSMLNTIQRNYGIRLNSLTEVIAKNTGGTAQATTPFKVAAG